MRKSQIISGVLLMAATAACTTASHAQQLQVVTAGSSAQFGVFAAAAYAEAKASGYAAYHYTAKSSQCTNGVAPTACVYIKDMRNTPSIVIPNEPANIWIVWTESGAGVPQKIWAYLSVDSTVGVRSFMAVPRAHLELDTDVNGLPAPSSSNANLNVWSDGSLDTALTAYNAKGVYNALNDAPLTAANTDIRPEDALFATGKYLYKYRQSSSFPGDQIGYGIESYFTPTVNVANPVNFALSGKDPISGATISNPMVTIPIGAAPITFLVNRSDANGLGFTNGGSSYTITDLSVHSTHAAGTLFSGTTCDTSVFAGGPSTPVAVNPILREPLSGTMNTTEFSAFNIYDGGSSPDGQSQENGVTPGKAGTAGVDNPLNKPCSTGGSRYRAVGTGDEVNAVKATTLQDQIGYIFFSYEATNGVANSSTINYLTLDGVDGLNGSYSTSAGELPLCSRTVSGGAVTTVTNCTAQETGFNGKFFHYNSYPHLRDGTYRSWSEYRMITDSTGQQDAQALVTIANNIVDTTLPDFVPFAPVCGGTNLHPETPYEEGLTVYREHFTQSGVTGDNGPQHAALGCANAPTSLPFLTLGGGTGSGSEAGGDVGGLIQGPFTTSDQPVPPGVLNGHQ